MYFGPERKNVRLRDYNYSGDGYYFVTICVRNRENHFGEIVGGEVVLNDLGNYSKECWQNIPNHFEMVKLDEFVIMPNHIHGIIHIVGNEYFRSKTAINSKTAIDFNTTRNENIRSLRKGILSSVIKGFKIGVTKWCNENFNNHDGFYWQKSFHDTIIKNYEQLNNIRKYIKANPSKWELDEENVNL